MHDFFYELLIQQHKQQTELVQLSIKKPVNTPQNGKVKRALQGLNFKVFTEPKIHLFLTTNTVNKVTSSAFL